MNILLLLVLANGLMPPAQQTALVQKYCSVCHTDAVKNGGLSLQHYDAATPNPPLAAMLLTKLNGGAMGAAGLPIPNKPTQDAWIAATSAQSEHAGDWNVIHASVLTASVVRDVPTRKPALYRLTLTCDTESHRGEIQLTWSPQPQTDRTFFVSADGAPAIGHRLEGREEKMGNGAIAATGLAAAKLNTPFAEKSLTVTGLFPGEKTVFPLAGLDPATRKQLGVCLNH